MAGRSGSEGFYRNYRIMITGSRIYLRAVEPEDVDTIYRFENDTKYWDVSDTEEPVSRFTVEQYILSASHDIFTTGELKLMVCLRSGDIPIGMVDLFQFDARHRRAGLGILINSASQHQGYGSEALDLVMQYAFHTLGLHQLYCNILTDNEVSLQLFQGRGFSVIGMKKEWRWIGSRWKDEFMLQKINNQEITFNLDGIQNQ